MYIPPTPTIETAFWHSLAQQKIDNLKLDDRQLPIKLELPNLTELDDPAVNKIYINFDAFDSGNENDTNIFGYLKNENTIEAFKKSSKQGLIDEIGKNIFENLENLRQNPNKLFGFFLYSFVDLKKWHFSYWPGFASINSKIFEHSIEEIENLPHLVLKNPSNHNFFVYNNSSSNEDKILPLPEKFKAENYSFAFNDTTTNPQAVSLVARNFAFFIYKYYNLTSFQMLAYRGPKIPSKLLKFTISSSLPTESSNLKFTGWCKNPSTGKLQSSKIDLSSMMNKEKLASDAANLNLKLMKWRVAPNLDLEKIQSRKALLLGAGTLGSNVARNLIGWGIKHITFVDCGKVSYSNPVRQSLFNFDQIGEKKAESACKALKNISPDIQANYFEYLIPMPDHPSSVKATNDKQQKIIEENYLKFEKLIQEHDVIFLLTDTRESRWLPTMLGGFYNKIVINAALGFDSLVVMHHGNKLTNYACYFCQDVVAPQDSTTNRTLDQQCTVSRPGLSFIASGLAVELAINAITDTLNGGKELQDKLPQQIRFFLANYNQVAIQKMEKFQLCTGCGNCVYQAYEEEKWDFVRGICDGSTKLEEVSGLIKLQEADVDIGIISGSDDDF